ncbi:MAG: HAMP domain-containing histidine kinase [Nitrospirae bacterium]|nr:HAMP domain-containing histidine kinase [Nitrospirota bacterium]
MQLLRLKIEQTSSESIIRHGIDIIEVYLDRASHASRNLMAVNKLNRAEFKRVDINTLLKDVVTGMAGVLENAMLHYELSVDAYARGNYMALKSCFTHILSNSIESMPEGRGMVTISTRPDGNKIRIDVVDTGCGISKECAQKVFEPCFTTKDKPDGLGLGLVVVHELISQHNGEVEFYSSPGEGTRVTIVLPAGDEQ